MWRQIPTFVKTGVLSVALPALVIASSVGVRDHQEAVQRAQRAADAKQAQRLDRTAAVSRWQAEALTEADAQRDAAQARTGELQQALDAANAEKAKLQQQIDALQAASVGLGSGPAAVGNPVTAGPVANRYPWGWCTWYVASRRYVPWNGNAGTWLWGARAFGFATGSTPRVGAIMVTAESVWGHVALVEAVGSGGTFTVSEMNFNAWGVVDFRTVVPGRVPILGFIYT